VNENFLNNQHYSFWKEEHGQASQKGGEKESRRNSRPRGIFLGLREKLGSEPREGGKLETGGIYTRPRRPLYRPD